MNIIENDKGFTPLLTAVAFNDDSIVDLLLKYRADPLVCTREGRNSFFIAAERGNNNILCMLFDICVIDIHIPVTLSGSATALHIACIFNKVHTVSFLLHRGSDPYRKDEKGKTPLDRAKESSSIASEQCILMVYSNV